jgi:hypothetical protein
VLNRTVAAVIQYKEITMKTFKVVILILIFCLVSPFQSLADDLGTVRLSMIEGGVNIFDHETEEWVPAYLNMPIDQGDIISVPRDGRAELHIRGGIFVRLDHSTSFELVSYNDKDAHFYLDRGQIYINNRKGGREIIQIDTPDATCNTADNSISLLEVTDSGTTELSLIKGFGFIENRQGKTRVTSGNSFKISAYGAEVSPISPPDEWEKWNRQRDMDIQRLGESARYLPEELHEYSNDFDNHGRWAFDRQYGYVWTPIVVGFDWVPFRLGQWIWVRNDYVWVSNERWGWAPHHYGRWTHISGRGWCWVPPRAGAVSWVPGAVAWVKTSSSIGWVPLAPGEVYYGRKRYGHGTVVYGSDTHSLPRPVYRNVTINNSVTVVTIDSFNRRNGYKHVLRNENPFKQNKHVTPVIPPPQPRKVRADLPKPPVTEAKPTMHTQQPGRNVSRPLPPQYDYKRDSDNARGSAKPVNSKEVLPTQTAHPTAVDRATGSTPPATVSKPLPPQYGQTGSERIPGQSRKVYKTDDKQERGPRPFVRNSEQSAFTKEQPRPLQLKRLEEPRRENKRSEGKFKPDQSPGGSHKSESASPQQKNQREKSDKR